LALIKLQRRDKWEGLKKIMTLSKVISPGEICISFTGAYLEISTPSKLL
jgi:hypothetical protein